MQVYFIGNKKMIELLNAETIFKSLADPVRLRIMKLLTNNEAEMCVCEFVDVLCEKQYNISKHLKNLENAKLITGHKEGRWVLYNLVKSKESAFRTLLALINQIAGPEKIYSDDQKRFAKIITLRESDCCLIGTAK